MRLLQQKGYTASVGGGLRFPLELIADELACEEQPFKTAVVPSPVRFLSSTRSKQESDWAIIQDRFSKALDQVAQDIVLNGVETALDGVPLGKFGKLITVDRREVESFRSIRSLIGEYCGQSLNKPLSIAVFGPPGSGKSFAVKQIAASIRPEEIIPLEFNLSQLSSVDDLYDAFHQVRDAALSGKLPLVFWDEFDSTFQNKALGHWVDP
jgi:SpoVK/Ycf46/Vps4 family AAA+-type ATPase